MGSGVKGFSILEKKKEPEVPLHCNREISSLFQALGLKRRLDKKSSVDVWKNQLRSHLKKFPESEPEIKFLLTHCSKHIDDPFLPKIYSMSSFLSKLSQIRDHAERSGSSVDQEYIKPDKPILYVRKWDTKKKALQKFKQEERERYLRSGFDYDSMLSDWTSRTGEETLDEFCWTDPSVCVVAAFKRELLPEGSYRKWIELWERDHAAVFPEGLFLERAQSLGYLDTDLIEVSL